MTSPGTVLNGKSVETKSCNTPLPYIIVLASSVTTMEFKAFKFYRIGLPKNKKWHCTYCSCFHLVGAGGGVVNSGFSLFLRVSPRTI